MSLAMYAAPFDNDDEQIVNNDKTNYIGKKKTALNKTQKRYSLNPKENVDTDKVLSVIQSIHNLPDQQNNELADFNPIPPPTSMGVQSTIAREAKQPGFLQQVTPDVYSNISNNTSGNLDNNSTYDVYSENNNQNMSENYYKRFIPNYQEMYNTKPYNVPNYNFSNSTSLPNAKTGYEGSSSDLLIEKLNYMINLLEEQQDERTNNVTEEVVLYSFLGIFIIFIVDSFARVGKYTR